MDEILPGLWHWAAVHPRHGQLSHSHYVADGGTLIDPMVPAEGIAAFDALPGPPQRALLTNRLHSRGAREFADRYGIAVLAHATAAPKFAGDDTIEVGAFAFGDQPAPHVTVLEVGAILPDEAALHIAVGPGAVAVADGVIRLGDGSLDFVPDALLVDDPADAPGVKAGLRAAYARIADELAFDVLLFAHGEPILEGGRARLAEFAAATA
jgi:hypothetical protein